MKYILAKKSLASAHGIILKHHTTFKNLVVLNEKEVMCAPGLASETTLEGKASLINGIIYNNSTEVLTTISHE